MTKQVQHPVSLRQVEHDIRRQAGIGIAVGAGNGQIFLYAGTEATAWDAGQIRQEAPPDAVITTGLAGVGWPFMPS